LTWSGSVCLFSFTRFRPALQKRSGEARKPAGFVNLEIIKLRLESVYYPPVP